MPRTDDRVDAYIANAPDFARPILEELRRRVHAACPEVEETLRWSRPSFSHAGVLASMSAFKRHCAFAFWKNGLLEPDPSGDLEALARIESVDALPPPARFDALVRRAVALNEAGVKVSATREPKGEACPPADLVSVLEGTPDALEHWNAFSPSGRREYVEWVEDAKRPATRQRRIAQAAEWIAEGKHRHWKYM